MDETEKKDEYSDLWLVDGIFVRTLADFAQKLAADFLAKQDEILGFSREPKAQTER